MGISRQSVYQAVSRMECRRAERINGILKQEFLIYRCKTIEELNILVTELIKIYNEMRPHLSLVMKTPNQVHKQKASYWSWPKNCQPILGRVTHFHLVTNLLLSEYFLALQ